MAGDIESKDQTVLEWKTHQIVFTMEDDDEKVEVEGQLTAETIKLISESMGISNLNDEVINLLVDDGTYRLKQLAQVIYWSVSTVKLTGHLVEIFLARAKL